MSDNIAPLTTEHLRIMRDDMRVMREDIASFRTDVTKEIKEGFADMRKRISYVEHSVTGLKRDEAAAAAEMTDHRQMFDRLSATIEHLRERIATLESRAPH